MEAGRHRPTVGPGGPEGRLRPGPPRRRARAPEGRTDGSRVVLVEEVVGGRRRARRTVPAREGRAGVVALPTVPARVERGPLLARTRLRPRRLPTPRERGADPRARTGPGAGAGAGPTPPEPAVPPRTGPRPAASAEGRPAPHASGSGLHGRRRDGLRGRRRVVQPRHAGPVGHASVPRLGGTPGVARAPAAVLGVFAVPPVSAFPIFRLSLERARAGVFVVSASLLSQCVVLDERYAEIQEVPRRAPLTVVLDGRLPIGLRRRPRSLPVSLKCEVKMINKGRVGR